MKENRHLTPEHRRQLLEYTLLLFDTADRLPMLISNAHDIYEHRHILKQLSFSEAATAYLAKIVRVALENGQRFRLFDTLKVLRTLVVASGGVALPGAVVRDLFAIYRTLILRSREEIQWCLSRLIKDQILEDGELVWLLEYWPESVHVANRLLRYPTRHDLVERWAKERYDAGDLVDRQSEIIALLFPVVGLNAFSSENPETLARAVMYARIPTQQKIAWLLLLVPVLSPQTIADFALRLNAPELIRTALEQPKPQ